MADRLLPRQKRLIFELQKLDQAGFDLKSYCEAVLSVTHEAIPFRAGWLFPIDPVSRKPDSFAYVRWNGISPPAEFKEIKFNQALLPAPRQLIEKDRLCSRGTDWWNDAKLISHPFYKTVLGPARLYFALMALLMDDERKIRGYMVLWREKGEKDFSDPELALLAAFSPFVGAMMKKQSDRPSTPNIAEIREEDLGAMVRRRAQPGVLILNQSGQTLYLNQDAKNLLKALTAKDPSHLVSHPPSKAAHSLPHIVYQLFLQFKEVVRSNNEIQPETPIPTVNRVCIHDGVVYLFRALLLQKQESDPNAAQILILIEKVSRGVRVDQIVRSSKLTQREEGVALLLLEGKTNKEVAAYMNIGEYTVKDHVKRIMKKLQVNTRAGIVAKILHGHLPP